MLVNADPVCLETLGHNIQRADCMAALSDFRHTIIASDFDNRFPHPHTFAMGQAVSSRYRVPQGKQLLR